MKKTTAFLLACALALGLSACAREGRTVCLDQLQPPDLPDPAAYLSGDYPALPGDGPVVSLSVGHAMQESSVGHQTLLALKETLEEYSGGKIALTIYPNGQLGSDSEMIASCIAGDIDLVLQSGSLHTAFVPEANLFDVPFLFTGRAPALLEEIMTDSPFRAGYDLANERGGLVCLMLRVDADSMYLTTNRFITGIQDLEGLKVRVAQSPVRAEVWKALGANPTPLAFNELYLALQNGTVDAQENNLSNILNSALYEVQTCLVPIWHSSPSMELTMDRESFYALPPAYQELLRTVCRELSAYDHAAAAAMEQHCYDCLTQTCGMKVCPLSDAFRAEMEEKTRPAVERTLAAGKNEELYQILCTLLETGEPTL